MKQDLQLSSNTRKKLMLKKNSDPKIFNHSSNESIMYVYSSFDELTNGIEYNSYVVEWQLSNEGEENYK